MVISHFSEICSLGKEHKNVKTWRDTLELNEIYIVLEKSHSVPWIIIFSPALAGIPNRHSVTWLPVLGISHQ